MINALHATQALTSLNKIIHVFSTNVLTVTLSTTPNANYALPLFTVKHAQTLSHVHLVLIPSFTINKNAFLIVPSISLQKIPLQTIVTHVLPIVPPVKNLTIILSNVYNVRMASFLTQEHAIKLVEVQDLSLMDKFVLPAIQHVSLADLTNITASHVTHQPISNTFSTIHA